MPRKRRVSKRRHNRFKELYIGDQFSLLVGWRPPLKGSAGDLLTWGDVEATWYQNREKIMSMCEPGERPWAWWQFEAPEQPRVIGHYPPDDPLEPGGEILESEAEALERMGLLTVEERKAIVEIGAGEQRNASHPN